MSKNYDALIDDIYQVLPADSVKDIAKKTKSSHRDVSEALATLRKNPQNYGWTIPHVDTRRIEDDPTQKGKYFAVILEKDSSMPIDSTKRLHYKRGAKTSLTKVASFLANESQALLACAKNERSPAQRYMLESFIKDMAFVESKARDIIRQVG